MEIVRQLAGLSVSHIRQFRDDDSYIDRLNHRYTTTLCVVFAILVTTKQYAGRNNSFFFSKEKLIIHFSLLLCIRLVFPGDPIDCWVNSSFSAGVNPRLLIRYLLNSNLPMKPIQIATAGLLIHTVRNRLDRQRRWKTKTSFCVSLDIPMDQELPDDEPGRRNKDIVNNREVFFDDSRVLSFALCSL